MNSRTKLALGGGAVVVVCLLLGEKYLAGGILGFGVIFWELWTIEVKLNLLLDEKGLRPTEEDYNR